MESKFGKMTETKKYEYRGWVRGSGPATFGRSMATVEVVLSGKTSALSKTVSWAFEIVGGKLSAKSCSVYADVKDAEADALKMASTMVEINEARGPKE